MCPTCRNLFDDAVKQAGLEILATTMRRVSSDWTTTHQEGHIEFDEAEVFTLHVSPAENPGGYTEGKAVFRWESCRGWWVSLPR